MIGTIRGAAALHCALALAVVCVASCSRRVPAEDPAATLVRVRGCAHEAERLVLPIDVYASPDLGAAPIVRLQIGHFVYRCKGRDDWLGVMYPSVGEAVDCAVRPAERACATGWVRDKMKTLTFG